MRTRQLTTDHRQRDEHRFALRLGLGFWELIFESRRAVFKHEQGALYVACLLLDPPPEPVHAMALALNARKMNGQAPEEAELIQERNLGLDDAEAVRNLRRKQRALETVLDDEVADSFGPGRGPWRGEGKLVGGGVLYLRAGAGGGVGPQ